MPKKIFINHYVAEAWGLNTKLLNYKKDLLQVALKTAQALNLTVLKSFIHQFEPHGLSLILVISESHLAIHTWPEFDYMNVDILSCSRKADLKDLKEVLKEYFKPTKVSIQKVRY